jgi:hypothetical protein
MDKKGFQDSASNLQNIKHKLTKQKTFLGLFMQKVRAFNSQLSSKFIIIITKAVHSVCKLSYSVQYT